ncbi:MAG: cob(I)yrinic acid a,c-diamide adenosyltransferase [Clostridiales bacterium]
MQKLKNGFVQIYTGNGKGKTTAALGQTLRAAGSGLKSLIIHFMKDYPYGEIEALKNLSNLITLEQYGNDNFVIKKHLPDEQDKHFALMALERAKKAMINKEFDIIVLDEICVTFYFQLLKVEDVLPLLEMKPDCVELILTGRYCPEELLERADLITEMKEVKHYYQKGITSRKGIES